MKITVDENSKEKLINLWHNVFGDDRAYIELIFQKNSSFCDIFTVEENGEICSVLYLFDCSVNICGEYFLGKYLYAAATDKNHRRKGLMGKLIKESQVYCVENNLDFIALLPANESLYTYYAKFGFEYNMWRCKNFSADCNSKTIEISGYEYFCERKNRLKNSFNFVGDSVAYAVSCLDYSGYKFYKNSDNVIFLTDSESGCIEEAISQNGELSGMQAEKYGMMFAVDEKLKALLKSNDIYMNIALD